MIKIQYQVHYKDKPDLEEETTFETIRKAREFIKMNSAKLLIDNNVVCFHYYVGKV